VGQPVSVELNVLNIRIWHFRLIFFFFSGTTLRPQLSDLWSRLRYSLSRCSVFCLRGGSVFFIPSPRVFPLLILAIFSILTMHRSWRSWYSLRRMIFAVAIGACSVLIYLIWFGMNSDRDNVPRLLTQLIPAGHCTCQSSTSFQCADCLTCLASPPPLEPEHLPTWSFQYGRDDQNLGLSQSQCQAALPGLFQDIQRGVEY
jgi:hypothetical protein